MKHGFFSKILGAVVDWMPEEQADIEGRSDIITDVVMDDTSDDDSD
ncbi:MAG: hypothetical protein HDR47_00830 [Bacteroides sp.]|nr:hypothetical protein [Bacteroides sp.]